MVCSRSLPDRANADSGRIGAPGSPGTQAADGIRMPVKDGDQHCSADIRGPATISSRSACWRAGLPTVPAFSSPYDSAPHSNPSFLQRL
jgi:hypothetical protein